MELKLLTSLALSREAFKQVESFLSSKDFSPLGAEILKEILRYYENDDAASRIDMDIVKERVSRKLKATNHRDRLEEIFQSMSTDSVSPANVVAELIEQKRERAAQDLANALLTGDKNHVPELLESYKNISEAQELAVDVVEEYTGADLRSVIQEHFSDEAVIRLSPKSLNDRIGGGARRGHHIVVVALPETGKTLFSIHMMVGAARHGRKVLYAGNEEPIRDVLMRTVSCMSGRPTAEVKANPEECEAIAREIGYDNITFAGLDPGTLWELGALVRKHTPDVLIVDQIRNIKANSENRTTQLEAVAQGVRNIARAHNLVAISITQGADSARNKLVLDMGDVDSSNVGIPGACDAMVMIGSNDDFRRTDARMLTLAKNKIGGRHESWPVSIIPQISRIVDQ